MNKIILTLLVLLISSKLFAQKNEETMLSHSLFNIQAGFGFWVNNETKLIETVALRTELGLSGAYQKEASESTLAFLPGVSLEPRWYFNLKKRHSQGRDISFNSANYWSVKAFYISDAFIIATNNAELENDKLNITINWGLKRNLSKKLHYEFGVGLGVDALYKKNNAILASDSPIVGSLTLRLGYKL